MTSIRVLIADNQGIDLRGMRDIIVEGGMIPEGQISEFDEILPAAARINPDVILLDLAWEPLDEEAAIRLILKLRMICPRIIAISVYDKLIEKARRAGAYGVSKGIRDKDLQRMIQTALEAEPPLEITDNPLDSGETEVLRLITRGLTDNAIGLELGISDGAVGKRMGKILEKLNVRSRAQAVAIAVYNGWIKPS